MWLSDFTLILPDRAVPRGSLRIEGNRIAEIADHPVPGGIAGDGREIFAGFIDMHGDMIEHEIEPRVKVDFPMSVALPHLDARLAAAGVTTAYASVSFTRGAVDGERRSYEHTSRTIREIATHRAGMCIDHRIHARFDITLENADAVILDLIDAGCVDLISFMDHTPGQGQYRDLERYVSHLAAQRGVGLDEARRLAKEKQAAGQRDADEILGVLERVSAACRTHGLPLASHDDDSAEKARLMAGFGAAISEFPVTMDAAEEAKLQGMMVAMGAPNAMRGRSYSGNLSAREAHAAGLLHILAADYHPAAILPAVRVLAESDPEGIVGAARLANQNPAAALGLADRGRLEVGLRADFAVVERAQSDRVVATFVGGRQVQGTGALPAVHFEAAAVA